MDSGRPSTSGQLGPTFNCCHFCPTEKEDLYKCPRCEKFYCSLRCYKSQKQQTCSEEFYKRQCLREEMDSEQRRGGEDVKRPTTTFEEYMRAECGGTAETTSGIEDDAANPQIEVEAGDEIIFDSDDEPEYLTDVCVKTMGEFEKLDGDELDKRMLLAGLPGLGSSSSDHADEEQTQRQMDALYETLTDDERRAFKRLADEVMQEELGLNHASPPPPPPPPRRSPRLQAKRGSRIAEEESGNSECCRPLFPFVCAGMTRNKAVASYGLAQRSACWNLLASRPHGAEGQFAPLIRDFSTMSGTTQRILARIGKSVVDRTNRLFAVVYVNDRQYKVSQDDIIHLERNVPLDVGERIKLEKVLLVGGEDFTIMGRPLLDSTAVSVHATVIEKTTTWPTVKYHPIRNCVYTPQFLSEELTAIRINDISVDNKKLLEREEETRSIAS